MTHRPDNASIESNADRVSAGASSPWPEEPPADTEKTEDLCGLFAGEHELVEYVGGGAMGSVYRGRRRGRQRERAIKVLRPSDGGAEALLQEAMDHPHVVAVEDFGTMRDRQGRERPYLVMELFGRNAALDRWVAEHKADLDERLRLIEEAAHGVAYAHELGVLHHDLKPANILVDRFGTAHVADFGLARLRIEAGYAPSGGTRAFQSPEQCGRPAAELDARSDVYALGATLFSVLTNGQVPITVPSGSTREQVFQRKVEAAPQFSLLPSGTPPLVAAILKRALAPQREQRYETALEFARAIAQARAEHKTPIGRIRTGVISRIRRQPIVSSIVVGMLVGIVLAYVATFPLRWVRPLEDWYLAQLPALDAATVGTLDGVRIVRMPLPMEMAALAAQLDVDGVQLSPARTWRPMHGAFVDAMSEAGARAIAFDLYFPQAWPEFDAPLAAAIERSVERGTPVVLGAEGWVVDNADRPAMPDAYDRAGARCGSLLLDLSGPLPLIPLVAQPPQAEGLPSFALATVAAATQPQSRSSAWIHDDGVRVQFWKPVPESTRRLRTGAELRLPIFKKQSAGEVPEWYRMGREPDWTMAYTQRALFGIEALDAATLDYARLLRDTPQQRADKVGGRVLVVLDPNSDKRIDLGLARPVFGGEVHAGAVQSLLAERTSNWMPGWMVLAIGLAVALVGATLGACVRPVGAHGLARWSLHAAKFVLLAGLLVVVGLCLLMLYQRWGLVTMPVFWVLAGLFSCVAASIMIARIGSRRPRVVPKHVQRAR